MKEQNTVDNCFQKTLVCPHCKKSITENSDAQIVCTEHGVVGKKKLGIFDFLSEQDFLPSAGNGKFDLAEDEKIAFKLSLQIAEFNFRELQNLLAEKDVKDTLANFIQTRAVERFHKNYAEMDAEIGLKAGQSIMNKVNPYLTEKGLKPLGGNLALEAGGGHGLHLPSFAEHFRKIVFIDCSLVNLIMGRKLAQEAGIADQIILVRGDATKLPFKDHSFDFVHESGIIEHVEKPQNLVSEALRILSSSGSYVCLSPNKYPLSPEPHFRLPLFGAFPKSLRKYLVMATRGTHCEEGTDLLSLRQLKNVFELAGEKDVDAYFLPRHLPETTRSTFIRRFVHSSLKSSIVGGVVNFILNKALLPIMPYHIVVVSRKNLLLFGLFCFSIYSI